MHQVFNQIYRAIVTAFNRKFIMCSFDYKSQFIAPVASQAIPFRTESVIVYMHRIYMYEIDDDIPVLWASQIAISWKNQEKKNISENRTVFLSVWKCGGLTQIAVEHRKERTIDREKESDWVNWKEAKRRALRWRRKLLKNVNV